MKVVDYIPLVEFLHTISNGISTLPNIDYSLEEFIICSMEDRKSIKINTDSGQIEILGVIFQFKTLGRTIFEICSYFDRSTPNPITIGRLMAVCKESSELRMAEIYPLLKYICVFFAEKPSVASVIRVSEIPSQPCKAKLIINVANYSLHFLSDGGTIIYQNNESLVEVYSSPNFNIEKMMRAITELG